MEALGPIVAGLRLYLFVVFVTVLSQCDTQSNERLAGEHHYDRRIHSMVHPHQHDDEEREEEDGEEGPRGGQHPTAAVASRTAISVAGRTEKCSDRIRVSLNNNIPSDGMAKPGQIILNPRALSEHPEHVQLFIFYHECAHHHVGGNEVGADCWAVHRAVREKWLDTETIAGICQSFGPDRGTSPDGHPGSRKRCGLVKSCYQKALAKYGPIEGAPQVAERQVAPQVVQRQVATIAPVTVQTSSSIPYHMQHFLIGVK